MSRHNSTTAFHGFSVFQPALGSSLQWLPALGSLELDEMIHTFLPGPASIQDKRAHISMDFFEYSRHTGENFRFYPIYNASVASTTTNSPASSSALQDSGYGSSFNVSPVVDMIPWIPSAAASTPASTASDSRIRSRSGPSQKKTSTASRQSTDFSNHPGMRILTRDGRDVTHSASRGCKSKEQRDHAHLMRIIKACDSCRRKKIRCDPSHKKRSSTQTQSSKMEPKQAKKAHIAVHESLYQESSFATPNSQNSIPSPNQDVTPASSFESLNEIPDDFWQQFVDFDDQIIPFADGYDSFLDPAGYLTSGNGSASASPSQSLPSVTSLQYSEGGLYGGLQPDLGSQQPVLPYLNPEESYGTNYQDFNLYSPGSELLDEEPQFVSKHRHKSLSNKDDNALEISLERMPRDPSFATGKENLYADIGHEYRSSVHYDVSSTSLSCSDWTYVDVDNDRAQPFERLANHQSQGVATSTDANGQGPSRPSLLIATNEASSVTRTSSSGLAQVQATQTGLPILGSAAGSATASRLLLRQESSLAPANAPLYTSEPADTPGQLLTVPSNHSPQAGTSWGGRTQEAAPISDARSASQLATTTHSTSPATLRSSPTGVAALDPVSALEAKDGSVVVSSGSAACSILSVAAWRDADVDAAVAGQRPAARPLTTSQAHHVISRTEVTASTVSSPSAGLAGSLLLPSPTPQGVPCAQGDYFLRDLTASDPVSFCLATCLLATLITLASRRWQQDLVLAVGFVIFSLQFGSDGCGRQFSDRFKAVVAEPAMVTRRWVRHVTTVCT